MLETIRNNWDKILNAMKEEFDILDVSFKTWLLPLEVVAADHNEVTIMVPESATLNYLRKRYTRMLLA